AYCYVSKLCCINCIAPDAEAVRRCKECFKCGRNYAGLLSCKGAAFQNHYWYRESNILPQAVESLVAVLVNLEVLLLLEVQCLTLGISFLPHILSFEVAW
ncbi:hypothetical protein ACH5RR_035383, partial [Cinchona calisaya]